LENSDYGYQKGKGKKRKKQTFDFFYLHKIINARISFFRAGVYEEGFCVSREF
jgi:hypothetical protein